MEYQLTQYKTFWRCLRWWHLPQHLVSKGHSSIFLQLHSYCFSFSAFSNFPISNIPVVNFHDTTFNLINVIYKPYRKPNDNPVYINKNSNHPPTVLRQLAKLITKRISDISSNEQMFKESIPIHEVALKKSGSTKNLNMSEKR